MQFAQPAQPGQFNMEEHNGRLALIDVKAFEPGIQTTFGAKDAIRVDIVVLDAPEGPLEVDDILLFGNALIPALKPLVGQKTLGRIGQGTAKAGQKPPWLLNQHTEADAVAATAYITARTQAGLAQPVTPPATPAPAAPAAAPASVAYLANTPVGAAQIPITPPAPAVVPTNHIDELLSFGYTPEQIQGLIDGGQDLAAVVALRRQLGAVPAPAA